MSDFILDYDILEAIAGYSNSLGKRAEEYKENLEKQVSAIENVTGPSSGGLISASDSIRDKIKALQKKADVFYHFAEQIINLLEKAQQVDQEVADIIAVQRKDFLEHHKSLRIENWKVKLLELLVDIENSNSVLAKIAKLLLEFDDIYESSKYTIKHWYKAEAGKENGKRNEAGGEENRDWTSFYGIMDLWEFPDLKNIYGNGKVDLKSTIKQQYTSTESSTKETGTAANAADVEIEQDQNLSDYEKDLVNMMNSKNPLNAAKYLGKYLWDRWPGYWGEMMEQGLLNSGVDPEWAEIGGDFSSSILLEGFMAITINGVRAYKNIRTGEIIYGDTVLGSGIGSAAKRTKTASSVVDEAGASVKDASKIIGQLDESLKSFSSLSADEKRVVMQLLNAGKNVKLIMETPNVGKTYDFLVDGVPMELKTLNGSNINTLVTKVGDALKQLDGSGKVLYDISKAKFTSEQISEINARLIGKYGKEILEKIVFIQ